LREARIQNLLRFIEAGKILGFPELHELTDDTITAARRYTGTVGQCMLGWMVRVVEFNMSLLEYYKEIEKC